jgi:hypothetical protein
MSDTSPTRERPPVRLSFEDIRMCRYYRPALERGVTR